jgi:hypothetical protein
MRRTIPVVVGILLLAPAAQAGDKLVTLIPRLFGPQGLFVDSEARLPSGQTHSAHFNSAFQAEFTQFNVALASQLTTLPVPAPASAFTYTFDESLGLFTRSTDSFGPIFSERAETSGRGKLNFGFAFQRFTFDEIEGLPLDAIPAVFTHDNPAPGGRDDIVSTVNSIETSVDQFTFFASYGLASRLDVTLAVPVVSTELNVSSSATVTRIGTAANHAVHFFRNDDGSFGDTKVFRNGGTASGLGDVLLRFKGKAAEWGSNGLGAALEVRVPTGDEENLLGSGAFGLKPFLIFSSSHRVVSWHLNLGYQWNGQSLLAGNAASGEKADMPDQVLYSGGVSVAVARQLTLVAELVGRRFLDTPRLEATTFHALDETTTLPDVRFESSSFSENAASVGVRFNAKGRLLLDLNVLVSLDDTGLRDRFTPLVGFEYSF